MKAFIGECHRGIEERVAHVYSLVLKLIVAQEMSITNDKSCHRSVVGVIKSLHSRLAFIHKRWFAMVFSSASALRLLGPLISTDACNRRKVPQTYPQVTRSKYPQVTRSRHSVSVVTVWWTDHP